MKLFKKPLAVFVALMIALGSISCAVYAATAKDGELTSATLYYRENGDLAENGKVSPGETVKATVTLKTDFYAGTYILMYLYNKDVFEIADASGAELTINNDLLGSKASGQYTSCKEITDTYDLDEDVNDTYGSVVVTIKQNNIVKYDGEEVFSINLKVKDDAPVDGKGEFYLPVGALKSTKNYIYPTVVDQLIDEDMLEAVEGGATLNVDDALEEDDFSIDNSCFYNLTITDPQNYVTLDGTIKFDAGNGLIDNTANTFDAVGYYDTTIGSHSSTVETDKVASDPVWSGYKFDGWSTKKADGDQKVGGVDYFYGDQSAILSDTDIAALKYKDGDDVVTLYAVYEKANATYTVNVLEPVLNEDGEVEVVGGQVKYAVNSEKSVKDVPAKAGDVIDAADFEAPKGFTNNSKDTMTLTEDGPNELNILLDRNKNNVEWTIDGESVGTPKEVYYGANLGKVEDPAIANENPTDKYFGSDVTWSAHNFNMPDEKVTVTGTLTPKDVTVTFAKDGKDENGSPVTGGYWKNSSGETTAKYDSAPETTGEFIAPEGYTVKGWTYTDKDGKEQTVDSLDKLPKLNKDNYQLDKDLKVTVTPVFEINTGKVTFDANGGKWSDGDVKKELDQTYNEDTVKPASDPENAPLKFAGWAADKDAKEALAELPKYTGDTTYYAVWADDRATVQWLAPNGAVVKEEKGEKVENISSKNPSKEDVLAKLSEDDQKKYAEGYDWVWDTVPGDTATVDTKINGNFVPVDCNIVYVDADGNVIKTISGKYGSEINDTAPADLEDTVDKKFVGWSMELPETMPLGKDTVGDLKNVTKITPVFDDIDKVTITYEHADGTKETVTGYPGQPVTAPELKDGDKKDGFDSDWSENITTFPETSPVDPITVEFDAKPVEITFDSNGGSTTPEAQTPDYDEKLDKPADPEKDGSEFLGWYLPDGTEFDFDKPVNEQVKPYSDKVELKAKFGVKDVYYVATDYDPATGEFKYTKGSQFDKTEDETGKTYTVPEIPDMEGFDKNGWNTDENGKGEAVTPDGNFGTSSREFYPDYKIKSFTVTYLNEDGTVFDTKEITFGAKVELPDAEPTKEADENGDFTFAGWVDEDGNAPQNYATMPAKELTFSPTFTQKGLDFTATYIVDGETYHTYTIRKGDPIIVPEDPSKFGYVFTGWSPEVPDVMPDSDVTFEAQFELDKTFIAVVVGGTVVSGGVIAGVAAANAALITGAAVIGGAALIGGGIAIANHINDKNNDKSDVDTDIPATGSKTAGLAAFAVISSAAAAAYVMTKKKDED